MSISLLNYIALDWVKALDLLEAVETEFSNELKGGTQLAALVPRIAHQVDTLRRRSGQSQVQQVSTGCYDVYQQPDEAATDQVMYVSGPGQPRGNNWRPGRGTGRGARPTYTTNRGGRGYSTRGNYSAGYSSRGNYSPGSTTGAQNSYCPNCRFLGQELRLKVDCNHTPGDCPRKRPTTNMVVEEHYADEQHFNQELQDVQQTVADLVLDDETAEVRSLSAHVLPNEWSDDKSHTFSPQQPHDMFTSQHSLSPNNGMSPDFNNTVQSTSSPTTDIGKSWLGDMEAKIRRMEDIMLSNQSNQQIRKAKSPTIETTVYGTKVICTADEGSELNCMDYKLAVNTNIPFTATRQTAAGAGSTKMTLMGETTSNVSLKVSSRNHDIRWDLGKVVIVKNLGVPLLIGEPGKSDNTIITIPQEVILTKDVSGTLVSLPYHAKQGHTSGFNKQFLCSVLENTVLYPAETISIPIPTTFVNNVAVLTPRREYDTNWPTPRVINVKKDTIEIENDTKHPILLPKSKPFADLRDMFYPQINKTYDLYRKDNSHFILPDRPKLDTHKSYVGDVSIDPDNQLSPDWRYKFHQVCEKFSHIITPVPGKYNGHYGRIDNSLNFVGNPPPSIKARLPKYNNEMLNLMADKMNELESWGVLAKPEDLGVVPRHVVPSMLVPKAGSPGEYRLVSDFTSLLPYIKKIETVAPSLKDVKTKIGQAKFHIELDFSNYFWQGGMKIEDIPYLATPHPFGGLRVYTVEPQGIRNASEHGQERLSRIFGDLVEHGQVALIADALYILADTEELLLQNFITVLSRASLAGLTFKPKKLIIAPISTIIFGWKKVDQSWLPCSHIFSPLAKAPPPTTVKKLRGFLGAYKQVSECIKNYAVILSPLEQACAGKDSKSRIAWTEDLLTAFNKAKASLKDPKSVTIPRPDDILHLHPDFSQEANAVGGPLYIERRDGDKTTKLLGGHFSVKLKDHQTRWLPCEGESLAAKLITNHFSHYIRESKNSTIIHTDNQPLVAAYKRLKQGEFSNSSRIASFLTSMCVHNIEIRYFPGKDQKVGDFYSRNPVTCENPEKCQICQFAYKEQDKHPPRMFIGYTATHPPSSINMVSYDDVITGKVKVPFIERPAWISVQNEDNAHSIVTDLISKGQKPEKKQTNRHFTTVKRMYNLYQQGLLQVARDGLITVKHTDARGANHDAISVPPHMFPGLIQALHVKLSHPSKAQLLKLVSRQFFCPNSALIVDQVVTNCSICAALRTLPKNLSPHTTTINDTFGANHAADVIKQNGQLIFISREKLSQFVFTKIIPDETANSIREALLAGCIELIPESGGCVRVDPGSSLQTLAREASLQNEDSIFTRFNISIDLGRTHNPNKNPVAENAVKEFLKERLRLNPMGGPITETERILITKLMNTRIRDRGVAAKEILLRRDLVTNKPIDISDPELAEEQFTKRKQSHAKHFEQLAGEHRQKIEKFKIGDRVYIRSSLVKTKGREEHKIVKLFTADNIYWATVRKADSQFRNKTYDVKCSEITKVPFANQSNSALPDTQDYDDKDDKQSDPNTVPASPLENHRAHQPNPKSQPENAEINQPNPILAPASPPENNTSRPKRKRKIPAHLQDFVVNKVLTNDNTKKGLSRPLHGWLYADWEEDLDDESDFPEEIHENDPNIGGNDSQIEDSEANNTSSDENDQDLLGKYPRHHPLRELVVDVDVIDSANITENEDNAEQEQGEREDCQRLEVDLHTPDQSGSDEDKENISQSDSDADDEQEEGDENHIEPEYDFTQIEHSRTFQHPPQHTSSSNHSSPTACKRPPPTWRGDSPHPSTSAAQAQGAAVAAHRRLAIAPLLHGHPRRRQGSSWDNTGDLATPLKVEIDTDETLNNDDDDVFEMRQEQSFRFPNGDRHRLGARSLPGRSIEQRGQAVFVKRRSTRRISRICYKTLARDGRRVLRPTEGEMDGNDGDDDTDIGAITDNGDRMGGDDDDATQPLYFQ